MVANFTFYLDKFLGKIFDLLKLYEFILFSDALLSAAIGPEELF